MQNGVASNLDNPSSIVHNHSPDEGFVEVIGKKKKMKTYERANSAKNYGRSNKVKNIETLNCFNRLFKSSKLSNCQS